MVGPLPDTLKTYVDATLGHLESALDFARLLAEKVEALEAEPARLRLALQIYGLHTIDCVYWHDVEGATDHDEPCDCGFTEARR